MARSRFRAKRSHRNGKLKIPLAVVAGFLPLVKNVAMQSTNTPQEMIWRLGAYTTGWTPAPWGDGGWHPMMMKYGTFPIIAGGLIHMVANKLGINRALSGIPLIRI